MQALEVARPREQVLDRGDDGGRLREAADARQPRRELADLRLDQDVAEIPQGGHVTLRGRVRPHPGVHRRRHDDRRAAGTRDGGHGVTHQAGRQLADEVGGRRGEDDRIGRFRQLDVRDLLFGVQLEDVVEHGPMGEALEGQRSDEARRRGGHGDVDDGAPVAQHADQAHGLVGGDAARDADDDAPPGEWAQALVHRSPAAARDRSRMAAHA